jgi:hypothetical protein
MISATLLPRQQQILFNIGWRQKSLQQIIIDIFLMDVIMDENRRSAKLYNTIQSTQNPCQGEFLYIRKDQICKQ